MSDIRHYFSIGAGSPLWAEITEFKRLEREQLKMRQALTKELCLPRTDGLEEHFFAYGHGALAGIKVVAAKQKKGAPYRSITNEERRINRPGWRMGAAQQLNVPDKRTPEGKAIAAKLRAVPCDLNWMSISQRLFKHDWVMFGMKTHFAVIHWKPRGSVATVIMADCVLKKIKPELLKTYRMTEITATKFNELLGLKAA
jgi:hypothetical protein